MRWLRDVVIRRRFFILICNNYLVLKISIIADAVIILLRYFDLLLAIIKRIWYLFSGLKLVASLSGVGLVITQSPTTVTWSRALQMGVIQLLSDFLKVFSPLILFVDVYVRSSSLC